MSSLGLLMGGEADRPNGAGAQPPYRQGRGSAKPIRPTGRDGGRTPASDQPRHLPAAPHAAGRPTRGFTLIELLVVLAIISVIAGMVLSLPKRDQEAAAVVAEAERLAATLREARSLALRNRAVYAVVFNIQNGDGTSGAVINNFDGKHWYQIQGPGRNLNLDYTSIANSNNAWDTSTNSAPMVPTVPKMYPWEPNLTSFVAEIGSSWLGERIYLPARRVRFLAIGDQENGDMMDFPNGSATWRTYPATYPRPWFGWYSSSEGRLYAWGGYDATKPLSAFGYQGQDGAITGCRNNLSRSTTNPPTLPLFVAGKVRPLINGDFCDLRLRFNPDGSVLFGPDAFALRVQSCFAKQYSGATPSNGGSATPFGDLGDTYLGSTTNPWSNKTNYYLSENTLYNGRELDALHLLATHAKASGYVYITLARDLEADTDRYPSAAAVLRSLLPMCRVGVNSEGDIRIVRVSGSKPEGAVYDTTITGTGWNDPVQVKARYYRHLLRESDGKTIRGRPITTYVTREMIENRYMWEAP